MTAALLAGSLGRFLDEASIALILPDPPRLVGAILSAERSPRKAIVVNFMVDPEFRRRGYGRYLFRWELRALWALGYQRVHLWVTAANEPARRLYKEFHLEPTVQCRRSTGSLERPASHSRIPSDRGDPSSSNPGRTVGGPASALGSHRPNLDFAPDRSERTE